MTSVASNMVALAPTLAQLFQALDQAGISYALLRGYDEVLNGDVDGDIDLLVAANHREQFRRLVERAGMVRLERWGQEPHEFYIGYDQETNAWLKLDVLTELAFGKPVPSLRTNLAKPSLQHRRRYGPTFILAPEEQLLALLLHCLLDKSQIEPHYQEKLTELAEQIEDQARMQALVAQYLPPTLNWAGLRLLIRQGDWQSILVLASNIAGHLRQNDPLGTRWRSFSLPLLRKLDRRTRSWRTPGLMVALLAPDGAGKTTLARSLGKAFYLPTRYIYMGTNPNSGSLTLPTTKLLARARRVPLLGPVRALNSLIEQALRYRIGAYHRRRGRLVVFDRYGSGSLSSKKGGSILKRIQRWFTQTLCPPPDLLVYLDASPEVLYQRKQEHSLAKLEQQRQHYLSLLADIDNKIIIDASQPAHEVLQQVIAVIWQRYALALQRT
mgnify:CR=1 FL=1|jgi:thymidylate kinase